MAWEHWLARCLCQNLNPSLYDFRVPAQSLGKAQNADPKGAGQDAGTRSVVQGMDPWPGKTKWMSQEEIPEAIKPGLKLMKRALRLCRGKEGAVKGIGAAGLQAALDHNLS